MAKKSYKIDGFIAEMKSFQEKILPETFVAFQKWVALEVYKRIMQKTPVDEGILRGSWTISVGAQDKTPANKKTDGVQGAPATASEIGWFDSALAQMNNLTIGQIVWINNAMPYVLRIEFDGHSSVKAPNGMVRLSIQEVKSYLKTVKNIALRPNK
jgi:hypothetical protein